MSNIESNKKPISHNASEMTVTQCFNCGQEVELPTVRLEAMDETGQDVLCENCDENANFEMEDFDFIPFF